MLREYGVYPELERVEVPFEAGEADVPRYVDCYIQDAERRAEGYPEDMGGGRFAAGDYRYAFQVLMWLLRSKRIGRGGKFLEWGSGQGVVAILAQLLGMDAAGVELDPRLVAESRELAARFDTLARFVRGTYDPESQDPDLDVVTAEGRAAVYVYPWPGEEAFFLRLFEDTADEGAYLLVCLGPEDIRVYRKVAAS